MPTDATEHNSPAPAAINRFTVFAWMWAFYGICEQAKWDDWAKSPSDLVISFAAWWLLFRPSWLTPFVLLAGAQLWNLVERMPYLVNHQLATLVVLICIVIELGRSAWLRRGRPDTEAALERFAPPVCAMLLLVYCWAFFHKLNDEFFHLQGSCAVGLYHQWRGWVPLLPDGLWTHYVAIGMALVAEAALPVLLLVRRTRLFGVVFALLIHLVFGASGFYRFSAMADAVLFLFLPAGAAACLAMSWQRSGVGRRVIAWWRRPATRGLYKWGVGVFLLIALVVLFSQVSWSSRKPGFGTFVVPMFGYQRSGISHAFQGAWAVYSIGLVVLTAVLVRYKTLEWVPTWRVVRPVSAWGAVLIAITAFNGLLPHLGLRTESAFAMYSNIRTEAGIPNHYLLRYLPQVADYQRDLVTVHASSDEKLAATVGTGYRITYFEFVSYVRYRVANGEVHSIRYDRNGELHDVARTDEVPAFLEPDPYLQRKLLLFRTVAPPDQTSCQH